MGIVKALTVSELLGLQDFYKGRLERNLKEIGKETFDEEEIIVIGKRLEKIYEELDKRVDTTFDI